MKEFCATAFISFVKVREEQDCCVPLRIAQVAILYPQWPLSMHQSDFLASLNAGASVQKWSHHWVFSGKVYENKWTGRLKTGEWVLAVIDPRALGLVEKGLSPEGDGLTGERARVEGTEAGRIGGWGQSEICHCKISEGEQFWVITRP